MQVNSENESLSFDIHPVSGGYACYVSGEGSPADLAFWVDEADTAEYLAIENHSPFWCRPFWGRSFSDLPQRVQALLIKRGAEYRYYLPVCHTVFKTLIRGTAEGFEFYMDANCRSVTRCERQLAFVCIRGQEPLGVMKQAAEVVCRLLDNGLSLREEKAVPDVFNRLGWCSWDSMQIRVNHEGLVQKAKEFREKRVPIHFAIIDDMWADVPNLNEIPADVEFGRMVSLMHVSKLRSFAGDPKRFPHGMAAAIRDVKREGIPAVGVWFPTTGYWSGLDPAGAEARRQRDTTITLPSGQIVVSPDEEKATRYFDDFCGRVKEWGGDFVKIDNQGFHQRFTDITPIGESAAAIQRAIDHATERFFDGALINCMGMPSECMFNRRSVLCRCSDDFMPESREWFAKNVLQCAYNGLLQGQFYVNDWDMWWTDDEQAVKNSLCRAISGGPIYVSDQIGRTNPAILKPLCTEDGRIIRPDESATPTADCLMADPTTSGRIFKIRNRIGENGVCAVFNIHGENKAVSGTLAPHETGIPDGDYVYYEYFTKETGVLRAGECLRVTLTDNDDFRLYSFAPQGTAGDTYPGRIDLFMGVGVRKPHDEA